MFGSATFSLVKLLDSKGRCLFRRRFDQLIICVRKQWGSILGLSAPRRWSVKRPRQKKTKNKKHRVPVFETKYIKLVKSVLSLARKKVVSTFVCGKACSRVYPLCKTIPREKLSKVARGSIFTSNSREPLPLCSVESTAACLSGWDESRKWETYPVNSVFSFRNSQEGSENKQ